jgi:3-dehydroquinate synthetase
MTASTAEWLFQSVLVNNITLKKELAGLRPEFIIEAMKKDKKREGQGLAIILMKENFEFDKILDLTENEVMVSYNDFIQKFNFPSNQAR